jgi:hypothetical protein
MGEREEERIRPARTMETVVIVYIAMHNVVEDSSRRVACSSKETCEMGVGVERDVCGSVDIVTLVTAAAVPESRMLKEGTKS